MRGRYPIWSELLHKNEDKELCLLLAEFAGKMLRSSSLRKRFVRGHREGEDAVEAGNHKKE